MRIDERPFHVIRHLLDHPVLFGNIRTAEVQIDSQVQTYDGVTVSGRETDRYSFAPLPYGDRHVRTQGMICDAPLMCYVRRQEVAKRIA